MNGSSRLRRGTGASWPVRPRAAALLFVMALVLASGQAAGGRQRAPDWDGRVPSDPPWLNLVRAWARAATLHEPGSADLPAQEVGSWAQFELDATRTDLLALLSILRRESAHHGPAGGWAYRNQPLDASRVAQVLGLSAAFPSTGEVNRLLERGAVLHADIAMHVTPFRMDAVGCASTSTVLIVDGQTVGLGCSNYHWTQARALLDGLTPDASADAFARLWYRATITYLLEQTHYTDALPQITRARAVHPRDAAIAFEHAYYFEALAAPRVQALRAGRFTGLGPPQSYWRTAESSLRRALELDAAFTEARVHLGVVLAQLERHKDAVAMLQPAAEAATQPELRYYAELFLGRAEERLGNAASARTHYERARLAVPTAPVPVLALGRLARSAGDRAASESLVRQTLEMRARPFQPEDPWWLYNTWQSRNSDVLLRELYRLVENEASRR
jgi:hypothetical protein